MISTTFAFTPRPSGVPIFFISNFLSKISVFRHFLKKFKANRSDNAYLDRSYQYLQLLYWHYVRQVSQFFFISNFISKISVFRHFLKKFKSDRSDIAYLDRSYQYLQLFYWHQVLEKSSRAFSGHFRSKFWVFSKFFFEKSKFFKKIFSISRFFSFWVEKMQKKFFSHCEVRSPEKKNPKSKTFRILSLFSSLSHWIDPIPHDMQV